MKWQVQEAKQRFSEVLRAVEIEGPQTITKHGEEVAVVIGISEYRRLTQPKITFNEYLMSFVGLGDEVADVLNEVIAERKNSLPRDVFGVDE
ncbi:type II toxin-antitoxin system Phd/YefM family antitoxin [Nocardia sp. NPDC051832]|uniref:type II toxin-antitoxin system Phd/YefM family antitoxin n=1 Tax=Nocardia sp. NPDC051832 TaxID=3155673 RepID=UPI003415C4CD